AREGRRMGGLPREPRTRCGDHPPAATRDWPDVVLALENSRAVVETEHLRIPDVSPGEVLWLAVEVHAVVLAHVGSEEAVGAVGRGDGTHPPHGGDIRPHAVALGVPVAPCEGHGPLQIR